MLKLFVYIPVVVATQMNKLICYVRGTLHSLRKMTVRHCSPLYVSAIGHKNEKVTSCVISNEILTVMES